jgi:quinol monooxygenase YgiN
MKLFAILILLAMTSLVSPAQAQDSSRKVRIAKIEIYPEYIAAYRAALAEHAAVAVKAEPGVLELQAVYDKEQPGHVTVFEIYASEAAYQSHLKTEHFLNYKSVTQKMVKSLELVDVVPIAIEIKRELTSAGN